MIRDYPKQPSRHAAFATGCHKWDTTEKMKFSTKLCRGYFHLLQRLFRKIRSIPRDWFLIYHPLWNPLDFPSIIFVLLGLTKKLYRQYCIKLFVVDQQDHNVLTPLTNIGLPSLCIISLSIRIIPNIAAAERAIFNREGHPQLFSISVTRILIPETLLIHWGVEPRHI